ncbi:MAG: hypothetical protein P4M02_12425, partial [Clostridia bacterium]|nr:hypothetical protein [Clostridia bacterium]
MKRLTPGSAEDFFRFFEHIAFADHPEWGCDCYCCFFHADDAAEWEGRTAAQNRKIAGDMISLGKMNGLLAYADHEPVGWCNFDAKSKFPGLKLFYH